LKNRRLRPQTLSSAEQQRLESAQKLLASGDLDGAGQLCKQLVQVKPRALEPLRLLSWINMRQGDMFAAYDTAEATLKLAPGEGSVLAWAAEVAAEVGDLRRADEHLQRLSRLGKQDPAVMASVAGALTAMEDHAGALLRYRRLLQHRPDDLQARLNVAYSARYAGEFALAEACLRELIAVHPGFYQAYFALTQLARVTPDNNHIELLEAALRRSDGNTEAEAFLGYGLGKELEDLGEYASAFPCYLRGAKAQRQLFPRPSREAQIARKLMSARPTPVVPGWDSEAAGEGLIFIVGLPRTGSTLLDRMLGAHSRVRNGGELRALPFSAHRQIGVPPADVMSAQLLSSLHTLDVAELGQRYLACLPAHWLGQGMLSDKNPMNYLYVGLIRRALPAAKILHIQRNPMDACFSSFKQLFAPGAYRHSYDFQELAQHYGSYRALMDHWQRQYPDSITELSYESLVADPQAQLQRVLPALGLEWEDSVLDFHRRDTGVGTASFAQVRQPVYRDSVERWKLFEEPLRPLRDALEKTGVTVR